jgi:hypothetical protein
MQGSTIQTLSEYIAQLHSNDQLRSQIEQSDFDTTIHAADTNTVEPTPPDK